MFSISRNVSPEILAEKGVNLVIISNGSYSMIKSYRSVFSFPEIRSFPDMSILEIFRTPFAVYTDRKHAVYNALGMTLQSLDAGPMRPEYVRHGAVSGIGMVLANAVKVRMPIWKAGGDIAQLGGEFVLGPGLQCSFAHRMRYTRSHIPILEVVKAAGIDMYKPLMQLSAQLISSTTALLGVDEVNASTGTTGTSFLGVALSMSRDQEKKWLRDSRRHLSALHARKLARRGGKKWVQSMHTPSDSTHGNKVDDEHVEIFSQPTASCSSLSACSASFYSVASMEEAVSDEEYEDAQDLDPWEEEFDIEAHTARSSEYCSDDTYSGGDLIEVETPTTARCSEETYLDDVDSVDSDTTADDTQTEDTHTEKYSDDFKVYPFILPQIPCLPALSTDSFISDPESFGGAPEDLSKIPTDQSDSASLSEFPVPPTKPFLDLLIDTDYLTWGNSLKLQELRRLNGSRIIDLPLLHLTS
jgi:hypothetical protein